MLDALLGALFLLFLFIILYLEYDELDDDNNIENTPVTNIYDRYYAQLLRAHSCDAVQSILRHIQNNVVLSDDERTSRQSALDLAHRLQSELCTSPTTSYHLIWKIVTIVAVILFVVFIMYISLSTLPQPHASKKAPQRFTSQVAEEKLYIPLKDDPQPPTEPVTYHITSIERPEEKQSTLRSIKSERYDPAYPYDANIDIFKYYPVTRKLITPIVVKTSKYSFKVFREIERFKKIGAKIDKRLFHINTTDSPPVAHLKDVMLEIFAMVYRSDSDDVFTKSGSDYKKNIDTIESISFQIIPAYRTPSIHKMMQFFEVTEKRQYPIMYLDWYIVVMKMAGEKNISEEKIDAIIKGYIDKYEIKVAGIDDDF